MNALPGLALAGPDTFTRRSTTLADTAARSVRGRGAEVDCSVGDGVGDCDAACDDDVVGEPAGVGDTELVDELGLGANALDAAVGEGVGGTVGVATAGPALNSRATDNELPTLRMSRWFSKFEPDRLRLFRDNGERRGRVGRGSFPSIASPLRRFWPRELLESATDQLFPLTRVRKQVFLPGYHYR